MPKAIEDAERIREIIGEVQELLGEARGIAEDHDLFMANLDAYVFNQLAEHLDNGNPYNQSLESIAKQLEGIGNGYGEEE